MNTKPRHEYKLYINHGDYMQISARLKELAQQDPNAGADGTYKIRSVYFDNYQDKAVFEKVAGVNKREKFRIRLYNDDASWIKLEKKSKINGLCYKESASLTKEECERLIAGDFSALKERNDPLALELYSKIHAQQLRMKSVVDYDREAYIYPAGNVRITFDKRIRSSNNVRGFLRKDLVTIPASGGSIMEIKYDEFFPELLRQAVRVPGRGMTEFSKYVVSRFV